MGRFPVREAGADANLIQDGHYQLPMITVTALDIELKDIFSNG
jgi:hypothetical protein